METKIKLNRNIDNILIPVISLDDLIINKESTAMDKVDQ